MNINTSKAYAALEEALLDAIPDAIRSLSSSDQYYCLRVYFDGTDTGAESYATRLRLLKHDHRSTWISDARGPAYMLWFADETDSSEQGPNIFLDGVASVTEPCRIIYSALCENELKNLKRLRRTIRRVSERLNRLDWSQICSVTDDFVVFPADGSHTFNNDFADMASSVPLPRIRLLHSRGLLPSWAYAYLILSRFVTKYWK